MADTDRVGIRLSRDVFLALAAVGWADGDLDREEADGILRAATEAELGLEDLQAIEEATKVRRELASLDRSRLNGLERSFVYATAVWLARLDGHVDPGERMALKKLGDLLNLPDVVRTHASAAALEVAQASGSDRPARYDFVKLKERLYDRLSSLPAS